jgi:1,2-diacylglycerol 3-alpha-glucosyltransferase
MTRHKIAMIAACQFPVNYGSPGAIRELVENLSNLGHEVHVITYPEGENLSVGSAKLHRVGRARDASKAKVGPSLAKLWWDFLLALKTASVVRREKCEVIHAHNYGGCLAGVAAKLLTGCPMIYNSVNLMSDELHTYRVLPDFIAKIIARALDWFVPIFPDHIVTLSPELRDWFLRHGIAQDRVTFVSAGVTPSLFDNVDAAAVEKLRAKYAIGSRPVVMYAGTNNAFQRIDYLLRAFTIVREKIPDALLAIVGPIANEPNRAVNEALARELGIADDTRFMGPHTLGELKNYIALADVCVNPRPDCPGQPIKLLNYMSMSKPCVCFAGGAKGVRHNHDAIVAPDHDWHAMGEGIATLLGDTALRARIGAAGRETVLRDFDWRLLCGKIEAIYDRLSPARADEKRALPDARCSVEQAQHPGTAEH